MYITEPKEHIAETEFMLKMQIRTGYI